MIDKNGKFGRLPMSTASKTRTMQSIGKMLASLQSFLPVSEIHNNHFATTDMDLMTCPDYVPKQAFWVLQQSVVFDNLHSKFGTSDVEAKRIRHDKLQMAGIIITNEVIRDYIPDLCGWSRGGSRANMDASTGQ